ncbi:MAG: hypothetical protein JNL32_07915, partial [Candidatus Kapabacteria bacterium]|nr:hypothetical protein [Candidatus Kapabacteria bacterium]
RNTEPIQISEPATWSISVPARTLFGLNKLSNPALHITRDCYASDTTRTLVEIKPICSDNLRALTFTGVEVVSLMPQPIGEEFALTLKSYAANTVSIYLTDLLGRKFMLQENLLLPNGTHSCILVTNQVQGGMYMLCVQSQYDNSQLPIIISK